jgi:replication initiation factor
MINYIFKHKVSPIYVDKFSATLAVDPFHESKIKKNIVELMEVGHAKKTYKSLYNLSAEILMGEFNESKLLVQCAPRRPGMSFFRTEFNPAKVDMAEVRAFIDAILPESYQSLAVKGICTRIDATVDVKNEEINKLLISHTGIAVTSGHYKSGRIETLYLGSKSSPKRICVYDKVAEIKRKNAKQLIVKVLVPDHPITRIEARLKNSVPVKNIATVPNLFEKLDIACFQSFPDFDEKFKLFLMASRGTNGQNALLELSESTRKTYRKYLKSYKAKWWKPDEIWKQWPSVIDSLLNPPQSHFKPLLKDEMAIVIGG